MFYATDNSVIVTNVENDTRINENNMGACWAQVLSVGSRVENVEVGDWILVEHGRWSRLPTLESVEMYAVEYPPTLHLTGSVVHVPLP